MRLLEFTAECSLCSASSTYRSPPRRSLSGAARGIALADDLTPYRLCSDGTLRPCTPTTCDAGICWDCLHVCPDDPPATKRGY
jgi:hypothetical protein